VFSYYVVVVCLLHLTNWLVTVELLILPVNAVNFCPLLLLAMLDLVCGTINFLFDRRHCRICSQALCFMSVRLRQAIFHTAWVHVTEVCSVCFYRVIQWYKCQNRIALLFIFSS
jgi:hypothetical protein